MNKIIKIILNQLIFILSFFFQLKKNHWILSLDGGGGSSFSENNFNFARYLIKSQKHLKIHLVSRKSIKELNKYIIRPLSIKYLYYMLISKVQIVENDIHYDLPCYRSRSTFKVNLFHGMAVKQIYHSSEFTKKTYEKNIWNYAKKILIGFCFSHEYNLISVTNKFHKKKYIEAFKNKNVHILGMPRNDVLNISKKTKSKIFKELNIKKKFKKIFLYLPTFRDASKSFKQYENTLIFNKQLNSILSEKNSILITKQHFFYENNFLKKKLLKKNYNVQSNIFLINNSFFTQDLLSISDCLITDYSGVYFDYLNLNKKIIFYCYDYYDYLKKNRKLYFDYFDNNNTPGKKIFKQKILLNEIKNFLNNSIKKFKKNRIIANKKFNKIPIGASSELVYRYIFNNLLKTK